MERTELTRLVNEYTDVRVSLLRTGGGRRLELESVRTGDRAAFDATLLEVLASLDGPALARLVDAFTEHGSASAAVGGAGDP
jgi:hypothetical protein